MIRESNSVPAGHMSHGEQAGSHERRASARSHACAIACATLLALVAIAGAVRPAASAPPPAFQARAGLDLANAAAVAWAGDATLVYVENDEDVNDGGAAPRWGYLFFSPALEKCRGYSVRNGRILVAKTLDMRLEPPPVHGSWIDSGQALEAAERGPGGAFRRDHGGHLTTMVLMRGPFGDKDSDPTTWMLVYKAPDLPALFVVVNAADGKVQRTWRG